MKINFVYSQVYDNLLTEMSRKKFTLDQIKEMHFYKEELEAVWKKEEKRIIKEIEKVSKLKFSKKNIECFVVYHMKFAAISEPLTLKKESHLIRAKTILIHELAHILLQDNKEKIEKLIEKIYPDEDFEFRMHVPILLITRKVIEKIYGEGTFKEVLEDEMKRFVLNSAWPTVNSIYPKFKDNIIKFLKNEKLR